MNKNVFEGKWKEIRGKSKEWWSLINDLDLSRVDKAPRKLDKYVVLLQVKYGYTKQFAREEINRRIEEPEARKDKTSRFVNPCNANIQKGDFKMNLLIYLIVAAVIGWVATEMMHDRSNLLINIVVAVVGAFLAGYFLSPIFHVGTINDAFTIPTMLVTLAGSVILLFVFNFVRGRRA